MISLAMEPRKSDVDSILPDKKQFITEEQLLELWDARGLKYRVDELHKMLLERGLAPYVDRAMFRKMLHDVFRTFLVEGDAKRQPKHELKMRWPKVH
jgi:hypothetical protein